MKNICNHNCDVNDPEQLKPDRSHFLDCPAWAYIREIGRSSSFGKLMGMDPPPPIQSHESLVAFYNSVRQLTNRAFRFEKQGIDFVNAEDLERLLEIHAPYPNQLDEDSIHGNAEAAPDDEVPEDHVQFEYP